MTLPDTLRKALDTGTATEDQIRELITIEARELGMSYSDAIERAQAGTLPASPIGTDIEFLAELIAA